MPATVEHTRSLTAEELLATLTIMESEDTAESRQAAAALTVCVSLQSRGLEILSGRLTFADLDFTPHGLVVGGQFLGKADKNRIKARPKVALHYPATHAALCASRALLRHLTTDSAWHHGWAEDPVKRRWPVFSVLARRGAAGGVMCTSMPLPTSRFQLMVHPYLQKAGVSDYKSVDAHVGRPSGTSALMLVLKLDEPLREALGGWAPTSVMSKSYQQMSGHNLAALAADKARTGLALSGAVQNEGVIRVAFCCDS